MGFRDYLGAMDDYIGDDDMLGAPARRRGAIARRPLASAARAQLSQPMPGVPKAGPRLEPLGFPTFTFLPAAATVILQTTSPQKPFKGSRLVIDIARTGAATGLITVTRFKVGARDVLVNDNGIGAATFGANAFGVELMMDEAVPGILLTLQLTISIVPPAATQVDVAATVIGMTWS